MPPSTGPPSQYSGRIGSGGRLVSAAVLFPLDDYDLAGFSAIAATFGCESFGYVVTPNVDHLIRFYDDAQFRALYEDAAYVLLDSRFLARWLAIARGQHVRVCPGSDLTLQLMSSTVSPEDRIVVVGAEAAQAHRLSQQFNLRQLIHIDPPMGFINDTSELERCLQQIEAVSPFRYCFLAIGSPQQEVLARHLKARHRARGLALCIGASINFLTGAERRAPRWMQRLALEWLFRLMQDPGRLGRRYLVRGPRIFQILPKLS